MPMKLPSGQVVWVRVEEDDDEDGAGPEPPRQPVYTWGVAPPSAPGGASPGSASPGSTPPQGGGYGSDEQGGSSQSGSGSGYIPLPPPPPPYDYSTPPSTQSPYPQQPDARSGWRRKRVPRPMESIDDARQLHGFTEAVSGIAESVRAGLAHAAPDTVEIEFGLDIDISSGIAVSLIADARTKAAVRVTLGWNQNAS